MKKIVILLFLSILFIWIVSCHERKTAQPVIEKTTQTSKPTAVETVVESLPTINSVIISPTQPLPMLTQTPASWEIWTPIAPVPLPTAKASVEDLLKTNGGCSLPCWWGIEPGQTSFTTVVNRLSPLTTLIAIRKIDDMISLDAEFRFPISDTGDRLDLIVVYKVENEIIQFMEIYPGKISQYRFSQFLNDFGNPEEVWVEGIIDPSNDNPFAIYFYYPQKGIVAIFGIDAIDQGDKLQMCPGSLSPSILVLWEPNALENFRDITGNTFGLSYIKKENRSLISLRQATDQTLAEISKSNCFETQKGLWPVR